MAAITCLDINIFFKNNIFNIFALGSWTNEMRPMLNEHCSLGIILIIGDSIVYSVT